MKNFLTLFILLVYFSSCNTSNVLSSEVSSERIPVSENIQPDPSIQNFVKPYSEHIEKTLDSVLAYNPTDLDKNDGELNTALGNLLADLVMEMANPVFKSRTGKEIDMVLMNLGGLRSSIPKGPVNTRTAYNLMPFENEIVIVEMTGEKIMEMLEYLNSNRTPHPISGIRIVVDKDQVVEAKIKGKKIDPSKTYFVATSDYLQQGGDNMNFFKDPVNLYGADYKVRNAVIDYFKKVDTLKTGEDDRYILKNN